ncbi:MAG: hypothetical protein KKC19_00710 [Nanoarchaeota archaeon]|nr:hypothetical protein [Nanoarchaeota archaeon]
MVRLGNPKNIFWEAFLLTVIVFVFGLFMGLAIENSRIQDLNTYYENSEISLVDVLALNNIASLENTNCDSLILSSLAFADRIFLESKELDNIDEANKLSGNIEVVHRKYDLLRTLLWVSSTKTLEQCGDEFSVVTYLYHRKDASVNEMAMQNVWSKILRDLKEKEGSKIVLIPISVDSELSSLEAMISMYGVESYPSVIVNGHVLSEVTSVEDLEIYLGKDPVQGDVLRLN